MKINLYGKITQTKCWNKKKIFCFWVSIKMNKDSNVWNFQKKKVLFKIKLFFYRILFFIKFPFKKKVWKSSKIFASFIILCCHWKENIENGKIFLLLEKRKASSIIVRKVISCHFIASRVFSKLYEHNFNFLFEFFGRLLYKKKEDINYFHVFFCILCTSKNIVCTLDFIDYNLHISICVYSC